MFNTSTTLNPIDSLHFFSYLNNISHDNVELLQNEIEKLYINIKSSASVATNHLMPFSFYNEDNATFQAISSTTGYKETIKKFQQDNFDPIYLSNLIIAYCVACPRKNHILNHTNTLEIIKLKQYIGYHLTDVLAYFQKPIDFLSYSKKFCEQKSQVSPLSPTDFFVLVATSNSLQHRDDTIQFINEWTNTPIYCDTLLALLNNGNYSRKINKILPAVEKILLDKIKQTGAFKNTHIMHDLLNYAANMSLSDYLSTFEQIKPKFYKNKNQLCHIKHQQQIALLYQKFIIGFFNYSYESIGENAKKISALIHNADFLRLFEIDNPSINHTALSINIYKIQDQTLIDAIFKKINLSFFTHKDKIVDESTKHHLLTVFTNFYIEYSAKLKASDLILTDMFSVSYIEQVGATSRQYPIMFDFIVNQDDPQIYEHIFQNKEEILLSRPGSNIVLFALNKNKNTALKIAKMLTSDSYFSANYFSDDCIKQIISYGDLELNNIFNKIKLNNNLQEKLFTTTSIPQTKKHKI